jgi:hypothetical protein
LKDELKKLGLRLRPRVVTPHVKKPDQPGQIAFDDRGNAIYEWKDDTLSADGEVGDRKRTKALAHPGLAIVEDEGPANAPIRSNPKGLRERSARPQRAGQEARSARAVEVDGSEEEGQAERSRRVTVLPAQAGSSSEDGSPAHRDDDHTANCLIFS